MTRGFGVFARQGAVVFAGLMAGNVFLYVYYVLVGRIVGVANYGIVTALLSTVLLFLVPATIAAVVIAKLAADLQAVADGERLRRLANVVDATAWSIAGALFGAALLAAPAIEEFFHLATATPVVCAAAVLGLAIVVAVQRGVLQGRHSFRSYGISYIIDTCSRCIFGPVGAAAYGVTGAIGGIALGMAGTSVFNALAMRKETPAVSKPLDLQLRRFLKSTAQIGATMLAINVMLFYDTILVRHFFDAETAGLYSAAALVARAVYALVGFIPVVLLPNATQRAARGESSANLLLGAVALLGFVGGCAVLAAALAPSLLARLVAGPAFAAAGPFVLPYVAALVALAAANAIASYKIGLGRYEQALPLLAVAVAQVVIVVVHHATIQDVLTTILVGDVCALGVMLYRLGGHAAVGLRSEATS